MRKLTAHNAIQPSEFRIRYVAFGTERVPARWSFVTVVADSRAAALRLCRQKLRGDHYEVISSQELVTQ